MSSEKWKLKLIEDNPICRDADSCHSVVVKYDPYPIPIKDQTCCKCLAKFVVVKDEN